MRKSREEAGRTRERIIEAASEEIRANGVVGSGLAGVMKAAGLTHGGFYKHFGSKDQLVAESVARAFEQVLGELQSGIKEKRADAALAERRRRKKASRAFIGVRPPRAMIALCRERKMAR